MNWLEEDEAYRKKILKTLEDFHTFLEEENLEAHVDSLRSYLFNALRATSYTFSNNNLINYLSLHNEDPNKLNEELTTLQSYQKNLMIYTEKSVDYKISNIYKNLENEVDFMSGHIVSFQALKSLKFRNRLYFIMSFEDEIYDAYDLTLKQMKKVDSLINQRLK